MAERPSDMASKPAACGASSSRPVSAPRTITANWVRAGSGQLVTLQKGIETAEFPDMGQFDVRHLVGDRAGLSRHCQHTRSGNKEELWVLVDEASNKPRTGDPVDLGALAGDPFHAATLLRLRLTGVK
jgi:hypothetical protein